MRGHSAKLSQTVRLRPNADIARYLNLQLIKRLLLCKRMIDLDGEELPS